MKMSDQAWLNALYAEASWQARWHVRGRWRLFPFPALAAYLPESGAMVDIGCGHGAWAFYMAHTCPHTQVLGIDPDGDKISLALAVARRARIPNVRFVKAVGEAGDIPPARLISIIDVLYLIPYAAQEKILVKAVDALEPDGRLLLKVMSERPRWKFAWNWLEEWMAVRVLGLTLGSRFYFRPETAWHDLLTAHGLRVTTLRLDAGYIHPHLLLVGEKAA